MNIKGEVMKLVFKLFTGIIISAVSIGCCIGSRSWKVNKEIDGYILPCSGSYHYYTNGLTKTVQLKHWKTGEIYTIQQTDCIYKYCSNANGPFAGSDIYPATRSVLNALSFFSYSGAASGDYMLGVIVLPCYPIVLCELPIQIILDTVLLPYDLIAAPTTPKGYTKVF